MSLCEFSDNFILLLFSISDVNNSLSGKGLSLFHIYPSGRQEGDDPSQLLVFLSQAFDCHY
jgi:hypothetical protein